MILAVFMAVCSGFAAQDGPVLVERPMNAMERGARTAMERMLTRVLGARAHIESVRVDAESQMLEVRGLRLANPKGFDEGDALTAGLVRLKADDPPDPDRWDVQVSRQPGEFEISRSGVSGRLSMIIQPSLGLVPWLGVDLDPLGRSKADHQLSQVDSNH